MGTFIITASTALVAFVVGYFGGVSEGYHRGFNQGRLYERFYGDR